MRQRELQLLLVLGMVGCGPKSAPVESLPAEQPVVEPAADPFALVDEPQGETADPFGEAPSESAATTEPADTEEAAYQQLDNAAALLTTGRDADARQALGQLKNLAASHPALALVQYNMGLAYELLRDETSARRSYLRATDLDASIGDAWLNLGNMSFRSGELQRALQNYKAGLRQDEENMDLWVAVIASERALGELDEAVVQARAALKVNSKSLNVYNNLGLVYTEQGKLDLAKFIYQRAMRQDGGQHHAYIRCNLGRVYQLQGYKVDARAAYKEALEMDPNLVPAMLYLSEDYLDNRNYEDALALLERASGLEPDNAGIYLNLGIAYRGVERFDDAKRAYEKALSLNPDDPEPHMNLGILYGDYFKNYEEAVKSYATYRDSGGVNPEMADEYIAATEKEQKRIQRLEERKARMDAARKKKAEQKRLLEEQAKKEAEEAANAPPEPPPSEDDGGDAPAPEGGDETPAEEGSDVPAPEAENPWGEQQ